MDSYADKMPDWIEQHKTDGLTELEINDMLKEKAKKYIDKWGNKSKVGNLINSYDDGVGSPVMQMKPRN